MADCVSSYELPQFPRLHLVRAGFCRLVPGAFYSLHMLVEHL